MTQYRQMAIREFMVKKTHTHTHVPQSRKCVPHGKNQFAIILAWDKCVCSMTKSLSLTWDKRGKKRLFIPHTPSHPLQQESTVPPLPPLLKVSLVPGGLKVVVVWVKWRSEWVWWVERPNGIAASLPPQVLNFPPWPDKTSETLSL